MKQYVKDAIKKNKQEIKDLIADTKIDKDSKEKLMSVLHKEKEMLRNWEKEIKKNDTSGDS